ncbi:hypothetical protein SALBM135S_00284 [Streptomyces alboniger]
MASYSPCTSRLSQRQSAWTTRMMWPPFRMPFEKAMDSISALPSALTVSNPVASRRTEWNPVPVATSRTLRTPRLRSRSMENVPSLSPASPNR